MDKKIHDMSKYKKLVQFFGIVIVGLFFLFQIPIIKELGEDLLAQVLFPAGGVAWCERKSHFKMGVQAVWTKDIKCSHNEDCFDSNMIEFCKPESAHLTVDPYICNPKGYCEAIPQ